MNVTGGNYCNSQQSCNEEDGYVAYLSGMRYPVKPGMTGKDNAGMKGKSIREWRKDKARNDEKDKLRNNKQPICVSMGRARQVRQEDCPARNASGNACAVPF